MCNPRRVEIKLNEAIREAWKTTVEQTATATAQVQELARIAADIPLDAEMGDLPLEMLERLVRGDFPEYAAWEADGTGGYRRELKGVTLVYRPGTRQLLIEARLGEQVEAEARATAEAAGFTVGEVAVEAVGRYFSDGWGGYTEERARQEAQEDARRKLAEAVEAHHRTVHRDKIAVAEGEAQAAAQRQAEEALQGRQAEVRPALRRRLQAIISEAEDEIHQVMNHLVGQAYRQSLLHLAREHGGQVVADESSGSLITLELEIWTMANRPPIRIRFRYDVETGEIEEFIVDDNAPAGSERYHDEVAGAIAAPLARRPAIVDAGVESRDGRHPVPTTPVPVPVTEDEGTTKQGGQTVPR